MSDRMGLVGWEFRVKNVGQWVFGIGILVGRIYQKRILLYLILPLL